MTASLRNLSLLASSILILSSCDGGGGGGGDTPTPQTPSTCPSVPPTLPVWHTTILGDAYTLEDGTITKDGDSSFEPQQLYDVDFFETNFEVGKDCAVYRLADG